MVGRHASGVDWGVADDLASWWQLDRPLTEGEKAASGSFADQRREQALSDLTPITPEPLR